MEQIQETITNLGITIVIGIISLIGAYAVKFITQLTAKAKEQTALIKNDNMTFLIREAMERINQVSKTVVTSIEQTTAKELREMVKDGEIEKEEIEKLGQKAFDEVVNVCNNEKQYLSKWITNVDGYIQNVIEQKVFELKQETKPEQGLM
ncbi:hypothetical protein [Vallitalea maricola]|uniref:Uncharacterized protein n=1 Tax=Vallitalea maricola TaxID=3074433 RepID=A0ACB5UE97_9FIRM|nr:hypothetical protein AN2V17_04130 [Vallitalea sp. AN17-2]